MGAERAAKDLIQNLMGLGWSQKRSASKSKGAESTISRALNDPSWPVGSKLVGSLRRLEYSARRDLLNTLVGQDQITIVDACHRSHVPLTEKVRAQAAEMLSAALVNGVSCE